MTHELKGGRDDKGAKTLGRLVLVTVTLSCLQLPMYCKALPVGQKIKSFMMCIAMVLKTDLTGVNFLSIIAVSVNHFTTMELHVTVSIYCNRFLSIQQ